MDVRAFQERVANARLRIGRVAYEWYPYDTLSSLKHLEGLLHQSLDSFLRAAFPGGRILDVGCGGGEVAFFLESLGHQVVAIDHPNHNHNGMQGVRALRAELKSSLEIHEVDLDRQFRLPHENYDAVIFLGVLYHLRNPFYVMEELAKRAKYCLLSTRVARRFPDGGKMPKDVALAYLLDELELNRDESNYFIFSHEGLRVMLSRSYWEMRASLPVGDTIHSDPIRRDRDERVFCLLASTWDRFRNIELLAGWYESEGAGWRWTQREFALAARVSAKKPAKRSISMELFVPADLLERSPAITLTILAEGQELLPVHFESPGTHSVVRQFACEEEEVRFKFALSHALEGNEADWRERGIIVAWVKVE